MKSHSLNGTNEQIKINALIVEHKKSGIGIATICKLKTGLILGEYLNRPFNRLGYYEYTRQQNWKRPLLNFWDL